MSDREQELEAIIREALAVIEANRDTYALIHQVRAILARVPQGTAESWTDPKPHLWTDGFRSPFASHTGLSAHDPRTREQYDAEEGNRG